jgi:single-strand DNA-binding protein
MHNEVTLLGNVGTVTLRETADLRFARFTLATDRVWKDGEGLRHEATDWHLCTLFDATLDAFVRQVAKGTLLFVKGSLRTRSYEKDGERRFITEIRVYRWLAIPQRNGQPSDAPPEPPNAAEPDEPPPEPALDGDDDLPDDGDETLPPDDLPPAA